MWWKTFRSDVEEVFGAFLKKNGFSEDEYRDEKYRKTLFYKSAKCKICFYDAIRDGDVNCMLSKIDAPNSTDEKDGWIPYRRLLRLAGIEAAGRPSVGRQKTRKEMLREIEKHLSAHFDEILSALDKI